MIEIPESVAMCAQLNDSVPGKTIARVQANASPHAFAWFFGDPTQYPYLLAGRALGNASAIGGYVSIAAQGVTLLFGEGTNLRLYAKGEKCPAKHQLMLEFTDGSALVCTIQMYGGIWAFADGANDNPYYLAALEKPSPLSDAFDRAYFESLLTAAKPSLSAKALLATEQRIPGLGNGVLQDILFLAGIHPARKISTLNAAARDHLFTTLKSTLRRMADEGGRDVEKDLYGNPGGYRTLLSRKTAAYPCPKCGGPIERKAYLGGNVYFCKVCQPV